jgi:hypothetical protein
MPQDSTGSANEDIAAARRDLVLASLGFAASGVGFGLVYGLAAPEAGFSVIEATFLGILAAAPRTSVRTTAVDRRIRG